jgi:hypothetical protein
MHGSGTPGHWEGGTSGDYFDVGWNTFLHTGANNINQRGTPCRFTAIHDNIFLQSKGDAIVTATTDPTKHVVWANAFNAPNPTADLAVGDFDGDKSADLFLATGSQWFFAPGGRNWTPFGFSNVQTKDLQFGDFTHEGRTEVLRISRDHQWQLVRHVGGSWESLGSAGNTDLASLVVGDFHGDGFDDVGRDHTSILWGPHYWEYASPGRTTGWTYLRGADQLLTKQPIGRFDGDRTADVIEWAGRDFDYSPGAKGPLTRLSRQDMK